MKKFLLVALLQAFAFVNAQTTGIYESYAILNLNGGGNVYYDLQAATTNPDFNNANLGTFNRTGSLVLAGGQNKTFKCDGGNVTGSNLYYRVYQTAAAPGSFSAGLAMGFLSNDGGGCGGNQSWQLNNGTTNVLQGLASGTYFLEVYTDAPGSPSTAFSSNGGANYKATFTVNSVFGDNFNRTALSPGGNPSMTYASTVIANMTATTNLNYLRIGSGATAPAAGLAYVTGSTATYNTPYNTTLSSNVGVITWTTNFRWNRASSNPAVPASGSYGSAIILAGSSATLTSGNGYAIVFGSASTPDPIRLVRYTGGINGGLVDICTSGVNDLSATNNYASIRVTYDPATNNWSLYVRDDGATAWADPATGVTAQKGTTTANNTYTTTALGSFGFFHSFATGANISSDFDNFNVNVNTSPTLSTNGTTALAFGSQTTATFSAAQTLNLSGSFLTGAPGNITASAPNSDFQVSNNGTTWGPTATFAYGSTTLSAITVYVRFSPQSNGAKSGNLTFSGGGVSTPPTVALTGTGIAPVPEINVQGNNVNIASGDTTPSVPDLTDFGSSDVGAAAIIHTFTIQNTGLANLVLDNPAVLLDLSNGFTIVQQPASPVLPAGSTTFQVAFDPSVIGAQSNTVLIGSNDADEAVYSFQISGSGSITAPVATAATNIGTNNFTANWAAVPGAQSYRLDVSTSSTFGTAGSTTLNEGFNGGTTAPAGWSFTAIGAVYTSAGNFGASAPSLILDATLDRVQTPLLSGAATQLSFWIKGNGVNAASALLVEGFNGITWETVQNISNLPTTGTTLTYNATSSPALAAGLTQFRFTYTKSNGNLAFDDVAVTYQTSVPSFVTGYNDLNVGNVTTYVVNTNLLPNSTYHYRVRAVAGGASGNSNTIDVTTDPVAVIWNGTAWSNVTGPDQDIEAVIQGIYNTGDHNGFTAKKLTLESGSVTVAAGTNLTVVGAVVNSLTALDFVVESDANLIQQNDIDNSGAITVKRNSSALMRQDYTLWSAPVKDQELQDFSPLTVNTRFYVYNPGTDVYNTITPDGNDFEEGKGYLIRMPNNHPVTPTIWEGTFTGEPHNGNLDLSVTAGSYNAVGNPYPSTISADAFITSNNLTEALYFWRKTNNALTTSYATYTLAGGAGTSANAGDPSSSVPNGIIQVGQGFIAKATSGTLSFNNDMRRANNDGQFFRNGNAMERHRIWLNLTNTAGIFSQTMVAYMSGATQGVDAGIDGRFFNDSQVALTSVMEGNEYAVQGRALPFDQTDVVPMGFKIIDAGTYTIGLDHADGLFTEASQPILLRDLLSGETFDLRSGNYSFTSEAGVFHNRFELVYQTTLGTSNPVAGAAAVVVFKQKQQLTAQAVNAKIEKIEVYDVLGKKLVAAQFNQVAEAQVTLPVTNQILIAKVFLANGVVKTHKIVN